MTRTATESFTLTHAKYLASKVTADMRRCQQIYGRPTDQERNDYGTEITLLLRDGYLGTFEFGYRKDGARVISWYYTVSNGGLEGGNDDRPGRIVSTAEITGASFFSFLSYSSAWDKLPADQRAAIARNLPVQRSTGAAPTDGLGYWEADLRYASNGVAVARKTFRPYTA